MSPAVPAPGARAPGRWPVGTRTSWPEWYARHVLREVGLPRLKISPEYLRGAVRDYDLVAFVRRVAAVCRGKANVYAIALSGVREGARVVRRRDSRSALRRSFRS